MPSSMWATQAVEHQDICLLDEGGQAQRLRRIAQEIPGADV